MSVYIGSHGPIVEKGGRPKYVARLWAVLIIALIAAFILVLAATPAGQRLVSLHRQPIFWMISGLALIQFAGVGLYSFMYPQNRKTIRNRLLFAFLPLLLLPIFAFGMPVDITRAFGQTGIAVQQCFGQASASFSSAAIPQLACLQAWNTPYAVVERRKIAEYGQKECLKSEDEKISESIERSLSQFNAFDSKDKVVAAFRNNQVPLETADGQTYFANIYTSCLDSSGYDKNAQFKVVVLASFTAGSLIRDVTVSSSNASPFNAAFAKNGIAESYRVDFENKRRVANIGQSVAGAMLSKAKFSSAAGDNVSVSNLRLSCQGDAESCSANATLSGTVLNRSAYGVHSVTIGWGVYRSGRCDQSQSDIKTISFGQDDQLRDQEQRAFSVQVRVPDQIGDSANANLCGSVLSFN